MAGLRRRVGKFSVAAEEGIVEAQYRLVLMYSTGREVPLNYVLAHKWLNLAALQGRREAQALRSEIAAAMTEAQMAEAQRLAREWTLKH